MKKHPVWPVFNELDHQRLCRKERVVGIELTCSSAPGEWLIAQLNWFVLLIFICWICQQTNTKNMQCSAPGECQMPGWHMLCQADKGLVGIFFFIFEAPNSRKVWGCTQFTILAEKLFFRLNSLNLLHFCRECQKILKKCSCRTSINKHWSPKGGPSLTAAEGSLQSLLFRWVSTGLPFKLIHFCLLQVRRTSPWWRRQSEGKSTDPSRWIFNRLCHHHHRHHKLQHHHDRPYEDIKYEAKILITGWRVWTGRNGFPGSLFKMM